MFRNAVSALYITCSARWAEVGSATIPSRISCDPLISSDFIVTDAFLGWASIDTVMLSGWRASWIDDFDASTNMPTLAMINSSPGLKRSRATRRPFK